jgi:hypothetical protein
MDTIDTSGSFEARTAALDEALDRWVSQIAPEEPAVGWVEATFDEHAIVGVSTIGADGPEWWEVPYQFDADAATVTFGAPLALDVAAVISDMADSDGGIEVLEGVKVTAAAVSTKSVLRGRRRLLVVGDDFDDDGVKSLAPGRYVVAEDGALEADEVKSVTPGRPHGSLLDKVTERLAEDPATDGQVDEVLADLEGKVHALLAEVKAGRVLSGLNVDRLSGAVEDVLSVLYDAGLFASDNDAVDGGDEGKSLGEGAVDADALVAQFAAIKQEIGDLPGT